MFSDHGLCGLLEEGAHGKSPKCLGGNLGDFGEFCKGLKQYAMHTAFLLGKRISIGLKPYLRLQLPTINQYGSSQCSKRECRQ